MGILPAGAKRRANVLFRQRGGGRRKIFLEEFKYRLPMDSPRQNAAAVRRALTLAIRPIGRLPSAQAPVAANAQAPKRCRLGAVLMAHTTPGAAGHNQKNLLLVAARQQSWRAASRYNHAGASFDRIRAALLSASRFRVQETRRRSRAGFSGLAARGITRPHGSQQPLSGRFFSLSTANPAGNCCWIPQSYGRAHRPARRQ